MPHKDPDVKRDYDREWRRKQRAKKKAEGQINNKSHLSMTG